MTLLAVVAHPDDETFACGSMLLHAGERVRTVVASLSLGEAGGNVLGGDPPPGGLGGLREAELRSAARLLNVDEVEVLGLRDSGMSGPPPPGSICAMPFERLVDTVRQVLDRHEPSVVITLDGSDGHRDHQRVCAAVVAAVDAGAPGTAVYAHCLPRTLMWQWLRHKSGQAEAAPYVDYPEIGTPDEDVTTVIDTSRHYETRLRAIALHASQSSPFDGLPEDLARSFLAAEHLRRLRPVWAGGPLETDLVGLAPGDLPARVG